MVIRKNTTDKNWGGYIKCTFAIYINQNVNEFEKKNV